MLEQIQILRNLIQNERDVNKLEKFNNALDKIELEYRRMKDNKDSSTGHWPHC